jgi:hypothetical protein
MGPARSSLPRRPAHVQSRLPFRCRDDRNNRNDRNDLAKDAVGSAMSRVALFLLALAAAAHAAPARSFTVEGIALKLFDETSGSVVALDKPPNPYGMNVTLLVIVKLLGPMEGNAHAKLTLEVAAPASSDEATGDHPPWKLNQERSIGPVGEKGVGYQLFLVPFQCREKVTFTAAIGASKKSVALPLACAE